MLGGEPVDGGLADAGAGPGLRGGRAGGGRGAALGAERALAEGAASSGTTTSGVAAMTLATGTGGGTMAALAALAEGSELTLGEKLGRTIAITTTPATTIAPSAPAMTNPVRERSPLGLVDAPHSAAVGTS